ncbi:MAG: signal peptidase II [Candidatus Buchananbacteria bacterium]
MKYWRRIVFLVFSLVLVTLFVADRAIKYYFLKNSDQILGRDFFMRQLDFHLVKNPGLAFGLPFSQPWLLVLTAGVLIVLVFFLVAAGKKSDWWLVGAYALIITGAVSNFIDRLRFNSVIDYIDIPWFTVFNLADVMISSGVVIFVFLIFFDRKNILR